MGWSNACWHFFRRRSRHGHDAGCAENRTVLALECRDPHESQSITEDGGVKAGNGRLYPALPAAERKAVLAAELARQQRLLKDISKKLEKLPSTTPLQLAQRVAELVEERQATVSYLEGFSACKAAVRECDKQATAAARAK